MGNGAYEGISFTGDSDKHFLTPAKCGFKNERFQILRAFIDSSKGSL